MYLQQSNIATSSIPSICLFTLSLEMDILMHEITRRSIICSTGFDDFVRCLLVTGNANVILKWAGRAVYRCADA